MTWPDTGANALYVQYVNDALNRVTQVEENGATSGVGLLAAYAHDSLGRRSAVTRVGGTGASTGYAYDGASRLQTLAQNLSGAAAVTFTFGDKAANQVLTRAAPTRSRLDSALCIMQTPAEFSLFATVNPQHCAAGRAAPRALLRRRRCRLPSRRPG